MAILDELDDELVGILTLLGGITEQQWRCETRCVGWDVGALMGHLNIGMHRVAEFIDIPPEHDGAGRVIDAVGYYRGGASRSQTADRDRLNQARRQRSTTPREGLAVLAATRAELRRLCSRYDGESLITTRWGAQMHLEEYLKTRLVECVIHDLDLTDALRQAPAASDVALEEVAQLLCLVSNIQLKPADDRLTIIEVLSERQPADAQLRDRCRGQDVTIPAVS